MLWIISILTTTWLGFLVVPYFRVNDVGFLTRILTGWLLCSMLTGIFLHFSTFFFPLGFSHSLVVVIIQFGLIVLLGRRSHGISLQFDKNPWFLFFLTISSGIFLKHSSSVYRDSPYTAPSGFAPMMDREISFVNSVLLGCNYHRPNLFFFEDPEISSKPFSGYPIPLLFLSSLISLGASYGAASVVITFLNFLSAATAFYSFAKRHTKWPAIAAFLFLFNGSWASALFLRASSRMDPKNDLFHQLTESFCSVLYQPFSQILAFSKASSFSLAIAQFALFWQPSILSSVLAALIPSVATSFSTFCILLGLKSDNLISLSLLLRLYPFSFFAKPLYREFEMMGIFFAPLVIWIVSEPILLIVAAFAWKLPKSRLMFYFLSSLCSFVILQMIREGRSIHANSIAFSSVFIPISTIVFTELLRQFSSWPKDEEKRGTALYILSFTFAFLVIGGLICAKRVENSKIQFIDELDKESANWLLKHTEKESVILTKSRIMNPAALSGRQQFLGVKSELFGEGVEIEERVDDFLKFTSGNSTKEDWSRVNYVLEEYGFEVARVSAEFDVLESSTKYRLLRVRI